MKRQFILVFFLTLVISIAASGGSHTYGTEVVAGPNSGMPGWPIPIQPIPHHEPGQPARSANASHQVTRRDESGEAKVVELRGLDALLADGTLADPFQGNYRLASLDKFLFSSYDLSPDPNSFSLESFELVTPTLKPIPESEQGFGNLRFTAIATGDLNGDLVDEQIVAWADGGDNHIYMRVGELPGSFGKTTSAPAVVAHPDGSLDVVVQGYDQALWHLQYNGATWEQWDSSAGGLLLSGPAVSSRVSGELDAFAVGLDNQVYRTEWNGSIWTAWVLVDGGGIFPEIERSVPLPEVPAPAVAARSGDQLDLFRLGPDHTLWWCHSDDGSTWDPWENLGGMLASGPGAVSLGDGRMQVYALGADGALWFRTYDAGWGSWMRLGTPDGVAGDAAPTLTSPATGQVTIYLAGTENRIWSIQHDGEDWQDPWIHIEVEAGDIELAAGIGAADGPVGAHLLAQMSDGSLQYSLNDSVWAGLEGLDVSQTFDTGAVTKALSPDDEIENEIFDITTGHFTGDGRQQVVLAYDDAGDNLRLEVYDMQDGFVLTKTAELMQTISGGGWPRVAAGDVDGNGVDEIGLAYTHTDDYLHYQVKVIQVEKRPGGNWTGDLRQIGQSPAMGDIYDPGVLYFAGTLRIAAGDVVAETGEIPPNDEFVVVADFQNGYRIWETQLYIYDHDDVAAVAKEDRFMTASDDWWPKFNVTGLGLAVGNVDGIGLDDIVVTWPREWNLNQWPDVFRDLIVWGYDENGSWTEWDRYVIPPQSGYTFLDTLAVGDLDLDLRDEIILASYQHDLTPGYYLELYEFETLSTGPLDRYLLNFDAIPRAFNLAMGDFTGESLRVGPPSYRVQTQMTSPQVFLNLPPMHRDILSGVEFVINDGYQAIHSAGNSATESSTAESKRDWSLSTGLETSVGAFGHTVSASLENTYGEDFSESATQIGTVEFEDTTTAAYYDQVIYNSTNYAVWEYPVYGVPGNVQEEAQAISVVFPLVETTSQPMTQQGRWCDEKFYGPSHQTYNVWSYDPLGSEEDFRDYGALIEMKPTSGGTDFVVRMSTVSEESRSASFHNQFNAGLDYSYENELNIPLIGKAWDFSFRAHVDGSYGHEKTSTLSSSFTEASEVRGEFPGTPDPSAYTIRTYLYWAKAGYLVMDYQTGPGTGGSWGLYNKPDPAFILPWYGFPDPATGEFPSPPDPDAPPCGLDKQLFSHDIDLDPGYVQNGDTVIMTATVRNFSNVNPPSNVAVRFYLGEPAAGNQIGTCTIPKADLDRGLGPQSCSTTWVVSGGSGEEKVYAVIDPDNAFDEMHDEDDVIDNNVGYGLLNVASADYFDPGLRQVEAYQAILYEELPGLGFGLYLPTININDTVRYELVPTSLGVLRIVGDPFQVLAFRGGEEEPEEGHTFGPIPAGMMVWYRNGDLLPGMDEGDLTLLRLDGSDWVEATCPGYEIVRFPTDNRIAVPICQTGVFVLSDGSPAYEIFLPLVCRGD